MRSKPQPPSLLRLVAICVIGGLPIGVLEIWLLELSWKGLLAGVAAGVGFLLTLGIGWNVCGLRGGTIAVILTATAGAAGGVLWWLGMRPNGTTGGLALAAATGALFALFVVGLEVGFKGKTK